MKSMVTLAFLCGSMPFFLAACENERCDVSTVVEQCETQCASTGGCYAWDSQCKPNGQWMCFCQSCPPDLAVDAAIPDADAEGVDAGDSTGCSKSLDACGPSGICAREGTCTNTWFCMSAPPDCIANPTCECVDQARDAGYNASASCADHTGECSAYDTPHCMDGNGYVTCFGD